MPSDRDAPMPVNSSALAKTQSSDDARAPRALTPVPPALSPHKKSLLARIGALLGQQPKSDPTLREAIEELIDEPREFGNDPATHHERILFSNILRLRDIRVVDIMVPRADIAAIEVEATKEDIFKLLSERQYSRFPVYRGTMDDILGSVHLKDIMASLAQGGALDLKGMITDVPIVSPSLPVIDLLMVMRKTSRHMALVVDEYGGIDGMITIGDVIEAIIGEIDDEHDTEADPQVTRQPDGSFIADARLDIETFENHFGPLLSDDERQDSATLGGLVFALAGRVLARGEVLTHHSTGMIFEILDADPRKISRVRIRNIPSLPNDL
jgi:magnesium and cobalt transporter